MVIFNSYVKLPEGTGDEGSVIFPPKSELLGWFNHLNPQILTVSQPLRRGLVSFEPLDIQDKECALRV